MRWCGAGGGGMGRGAASRRLGGRCVPRAACVPPGFKGKVFAHSVLNTCPKVNIVLVPLRHRAVTYRQMVSFPNFVEVRSHLFDLPGFYITEAFLRLG